MNLMKWTDRQVADPWDDLRSLQEEINALFDGDRLPAYAGLFDRAYSPSVDVAENADGFVVTCELPGMSTEDIDVQVAKNVLTIKGEKKESKEGEDGHWFRKESRYGGFQRTIPLPADIDATKIEGELENGVLRLALPKREDVKPRQIAVKVK
jgi:HSP20 family protein